MPDVNSFQGKIGYTNDGYVFMLIDAQNEAGDPIKINMTLRPDDAMNISNNLKEAARQAANKHSSIKVH